MDDDPRDWDTKGLTPVEQNQQVMLRGKSEKTGHLPPRKP
jgi:hypothetical protein